jgi:hypothetical protein
VPLLLIGDDPADGGRLRVLGPQPEGPVRKIRADSLFDLISRTAGIGKLEPSSLALSAGWRYSRAEHWGSTRVASVVSWRGVWGTKGSVNVAGPRGSEQLATILDRPTQETAHADGRGWLSTATPSLRASPEERLVSIF